MRTRPPACRPLPALLVGPRAIDRLSSHTAALSPAAAYLGGAQLYLLDISSDTDRGRIMSSNHAALLCGVSAGPALGGLVAVTCGLSAPFFVVGGLGLLTSLYGGYRLPETLPGVGVVATGRSDRGADALPTAGESHSATDTSRAGEPVHGTGSVGVPAAAVTPARARRVAPSRGDALEVAAALLREPRFVAAGLANGFSFAMRQGGRYTLFTMLAVQSFGYDAASLGVVFALMAAADLLLVAPTGWLSDRYRHDRRRVIVPGVLLAAGSFGAISVAGGMGHHGAFITLTAVWALATASQGYSLPILAADVTPDAHRGLGTSLFRTTGDLGFVLAPPLLGLVADSTSIPDAMQLLAVGSAAAGVALWRAGPRPPPRASPGGQ